MPNGDLNWIANFIWGIADDVLVRWTPVDKLVDSQRIHSRWRMTHQQDSITELVDQLASRCPQLYFLKMLSAISDEEFDAALENLLGAAVAHLENNARHLADCDENTITAFLVAFLNMPGFMRALQEAHTNGHVDLTIEAEPTLPVRRRLGEAKIYRSPSYHVKGLNQLVDRYSTGRYGTGFLVEYFKKPNIKNLIMGIRKHMDENKPCAQNGSGQDHTMRWAFSSNHDHVSGEKLRVLHLNCNMAVSRNEQQ
jgi:hypothetical protein